MNISSSETLLDIQNQINPTHRYNLIFFSGDHKFKDEYYSYEDRDIMLKETNIAGVNVQQVIDAIKAKAPNAKVIIQNETNPNASMLIIEEEYWWSKPIWMLYSYNN